MNTKYYLGVDIGGTKCAVVRGDSEGHILEKTRFDTRDCAATVARILDTAAAMAESTAALPPLPMPSLITDIMRPLPSKNHRQVSPQC